MPFAIKAAMDDTAAARFSFAAQKTMYGGKAIKLGDTIFLFASENEGGAGLFARGLVTAADHSAVARPAGVARYTPRVSIAVKVTARAKRPLGRTQLKPFCKPGLAGPEAELADRFYRQATNKIIGLSDEAAAYLATFF